jgi:hypothetical protein
MTQAPADVKACHVTPASGSAMPGCWASAEGTGTRLHMPLLLRRHCAEPLGMVSPIMLDVSHKQLADESAVKPSVAG